MNNFAMHCAKQNYSLFIIHCITLLSSNGARFAGGYAPPLAAG